MAEDIKKTIAEKLLDSFPTLIAVLGIALVVLGLAGGITYSAWLPIPDAAGRLAAGILGVFILTIGVFLYHTSQSKKPVRLDLTKYGIKITHPRDGDEVEIVDVRGIIKYPLPEGYSLRMFRIYPGSERMTPIGRATLDMNAGTWLADNCHAGGKSGEKRSIAAFIVGPAGTSLIEYHNDAARTHRKTMDQLRQTSGNEGEYLPAIPTNTPDMLEVHRVPVKIK